MSPSTVNLCKGHEKLRQAGFSLIELMIVVAIIAILAAIAYPAYQQYIIKTNRKAAESCLAEHANYLERYYTTNLTYSTATLPTLDCSSVSQTGANYTYTLAPAAPSTSAYNVQAAPSSTLQQKDTTCATVWIDQTGARHITGTGTVSQCW